MTSRPRNRDPSRLGGIDWLERTHGALTAGERRRLIGPILRAQAQGVVARLAVLLGLRHRGDLELPSPPDSAMAREAESAATEQSAALVGHGYRTWIFGRTFAALDGEPALDEELFYVAALLHDFGLVEAVTGEDFTRRSADAAGGIVAAHRGKEARDDIRDAVAAHLTPGASVDVDGPEAFYIQHGALCDLGGLRLHQLSESFVRSVLARHPRTGLTDDIVARLTSEAAAVPNGRAALATRTGFTAAIRIAPLPR